MSFTYAGAPPSIRFVRLLIPDTDPANPIFSDEEIDDFYTIQRSQFQSGMYYSGPTGRNLPNQPVSYLRVAALALDSLANNKGRLGSVLQLLDVKLESLSVAAKILREGAKNYREIDDAAGAFMIAEQVHNDWSFSDRWFKQYQRQQLGGA